jgi:hypothetical protein
MGDNVALKEKFNHRPDFKRISTPSTLIASSRLFLQVAFRRKDGFLQQFIVIQSVSASLVSLAADPGKECDIVRIVCG